MSGSSPLRQKPSDKFMSYDIPYQSNLPDPLADYLTTAKLTKVDPTRGKEGKRFKNNNEEESSLSHGFFFGQKSVESLSADNADDLVEDDESEDEGLGEIYRPSGDPVMWNRRSDRSFKVSPETTPRHAISPRIGNVGIIGQNIALGHRLGVYSEDASLIPQSVTFDSTHFRITEDSPLQIDIKWSKPNNASNFSTLVYKIEASFPGRDQWTEVTSMRQPTFRIYHTDDKMFIGKNQLIRQDDDTVVRLRVRCHGELSIPAQARHWTASAHSKVAEVTFVGFKVQPVQAQLTKL